jgi:hypothetical protein
MFDFGNLINIVNLAPKVEYLQNKQNYEKQNFIIRCWIIPNCIICM